MSGSLKTPLPRIPTVDLYQNSRPHEQRYQPAQRQAAVKLLMALYNEYPLRKGEEALIDGRIELMQYAERGWFNMLKRESGSLGFPRERLLAGLALLE